MSLIGHFPILPIFHLPESASHLLLEPLALTPSLSLVGKVELQTDTRRLFVEVFQQIWTVPPEGTLALRKPSMLKGVCRAPFFADEFRSMMAGEARQEMRLYLDNELGTKNSEATNLFLILVAEAFGRAFTKRQRKELVLRAPDREYRLVQKPSNVLRLAPTTLMVEVLCGNKGSETRRQSVLFKGSEVDITAVAQAFGEAGVMVEDAWQ
jgi:hypothetical protein